MEIYERKPAPVRIGELEDGTVFERGGRYYMVVDDDNAKPGYTSRVVSLETGTLLSMSNDADVRVMHCRLTVWEEDDE